MKIRYTAVAVQDLDEIFLYIADDNLDVAYDFTQELRNEAAKLKENPLKWPPLKDKRYSGYRERVYKHYKIIYEVLEDEIVVHEFFNDKRYHHRIEE